MITDSKITLEEKGKDSQSIPNLLNFVLTSESGHLHHEPPRLAHQVLLPAAVRMFVPLAFVQVHRGCFQVEEQLAPVMFPYVLRRLHSAAANEPNGIDITTGDRRWFVKEVSSCRRGDAHYFSRLHDLVADPKAVEAVYLHLAQLDIADFRPWPVPHTDEKTEMAMAGRHNVMMFMQDLSTTGLWDDKPTRIHTDRLYDDYVEWCGKQPSWIRSVEKRNMVKMIRQVLGFESVVCSIHGQTKRGLEMPAKPDFVKLMKHKNVWDELAE